MTHPQMPNIPGANVMHDTLDFVKPVGQHERAGPDGTHVGGRAGQENQ
jgi:hypothetical protein